MTKPSEQDARHLSKDVLLLREEALLTLLETLGRYGMTIADVGNPAVRARLEELVAQKKS